MKKVSKAKRIYKTIDFYTLRRIKFKRICRKFRNRFYTSEKLESVEQCAIMMIDGKLDIGGLADRLRCCLSVYKLCKDKNIDFKINFTDPFELTTYFIPNTYNWIIEPEKISFNKQQTSVFCLQARNIAFGSHKFFKNTINKLISKKNTQQHFYSNVFFDPEQYSISFNELFKPSQVLQQALDENIQAIGNCKYYSATFRFQQLLGDFKEMRYKTLEKEEQEKLIVKCLFEVEKLIKELPKDYKLLVTSDSITFLNRAKLLDRVYVIPGNIIHAFYKSEQENGHLKSFIDFMMISKAEKVYAPATGDMYNSGFPWLAAKIGDAKFYRIIF